MADVIVSGFGDLQSELEKAKESLKFVDENIKKLTGRDPTEARAIAQQRRNSANQGGLGGGGGGVAAAAGGGGGLEFRGRGFVSGLGDRRRDGAADGQQPTKRRALGPLRGRLGPRDRRQRDEDSGDEDLSRKPTVQSSVVANPKEQKTRKDCIEEQKPDAKGMARNRRMFGLLLGTLQKFRVESQQTQDKEQKRIEIEQKLDAIAEKEKEELRKERQELFQERRRRQGELRRLEFKMELVKQHEDWEKHYKQLQNFIRTKTKPHLFYVPNKPNAVGEKRLAETRQELEAVIVEKRRKMEEDVAALGKRKVINNNNDNEVMGVARETVVGNRRHKRQRSEKNGAEDDDEDDDEEESDGGGGGGGEGLLKENQVPEMMEAALGGEGEGEREGDEEEEGEILEGKIIKSEAMVDVMIPMEQGEAGGEEGDGGQGGVECKEVENVLDVAEMSSVAAKVEVEMEVEDGEEESQTPPAVKTEETTGEENGVIVSEDLIDQTNLTEKEFEPIYD